ncbi:MAG: methyltransferase domain-containing protein [Luteimonas sp.]
MKRTSDPAIQLDYVALESLRIPRPVDRLDFMSSRVGGKTVFDLGALDETAIDAKRGTDNWLHARLCASAAKVVGIDNSMQVPDGGLATVNGGVIIHADIFNLAPVIEQHGTPDVVVAGELIEHLPDTEAFLRSLKQNPALKGAEFVFSTPNACCWHNFLIGLAGRESMHRDHLQIYSYKTLRTLFDRAGIELQALVPCHVRFHEMLDESRGLKKAAVRGFQTLVNGLEWAAPILSAGWVGVARL